MFLGHENLRGVKEQYEITPEQQQEYMRCAFDPIYFAEHYVYIKSNKKGMHLVKLFDYQKKALKIFNSEEYDGRENAIVLMPENAIVLMPRQMGKCFFKDVNLTIRDVLSGEIRQVSGSELFGMAEDGN